MKEAIEGALHTYELDHDSVHRDASIEQALEQLVAERSLSGAVMLTFHVANGRRTMKVMHTGDVPTPIETLDMLATVIEGMIRFGAREDHV